MAAPTRAHPFVVVREGGPGLDQLDRPVIALGNFDGVHRGHRALIAQAGRIAEAEQKPLAAMVFEPYPREFFQPSTEPFRLTSFRAKARLLSDAGVDLLIVIGFDAEIAGKLAQDFVMEVLVHELAATHVVVGEDFRPS